MDAWHSLTNIPYFQDRYDPCYQFHMTMRTIISLLAIAILPAAGSAQTKADPIPKAKVNWVHINDMEKLVIAEPKPIIMDVFTTWCGPCKMMMAKTFTNQSVVKFVNENFHAVKFNAEGNDTISFQGNKYINPGYDPKKAKTRNGTHQFAGIASVNGRLAYPTLVYLNEKLEILQSIQGYMTPEQLEPIVTFFGEGHYKKGTDFKEWRASFKSKFGS